MPKEKFLNPNQVSVLQEKTWQVKPDGAYLTLYADDYRDGSWTEMCAIVGVKPSAVEMTVLFFGYK